jgi:hypothetical protein
VFEFKCLAGQQPGNALQTLFRVPHGTLPGECEQEFLSPPHTRYCARELNQIVNAFFLGM